MKRGIPNAENHAINPNTEHALEHAIKHVITLGLDPIEKYVVQCDIALVIWHDIAYVINYV